MNKVTSKGRSNRMSVGVGKWSGMKSVMWFMDDPYGLVRGSGGYEAMKVLQIIKFFRVCIYGTVSI